MVVFGLMKSSLLENGQAAFVQHRNHGAVEPAAVAGVGSAALRLERVGIDVLAAPALERGDRVRTDALRHEAGLGRKGRDRKPMGPPLDPIGTRDMHSMPPATTRSSHPEAIFWAAMFTASRPEAQKRSNCTPATDSSQSAFCTIILVISEPCSPIGVTQPMTTSST
jgi:hypothetical protein